MEEQKIYEIAECNYPLLQAKIEKLNKKAKKLNCEPLTLTEVGHIDRKLEKDFVTHITRFIQCTITGTAPIISSWELIASCEPKENGNLIKSIPGKEYPEKYRNLLICEHCNSNRFRKFTFIVRNIETNQYKMVGKSCLKDFLGYADPNFYAEMLEMLGTDWITEYNDIPQGGHKERFETLRYLSFVSACIRESGWVSRTKATETGAYSTSDFAIESIDSILHPHHDKYGNLIEYPRPTEQDKELAEKSLEWAKGLTDLKNDYLYNINLLAYETSFTSKDLGFAASIVSSYTREIERQIEKEKRATASKQESISDYVGKVGEKLQTELTFANVYSYETQYGVTNIYKFLDNEGNVFIWKSSTYQELTQGNAYQLKGTIKDHSEYGNVKQTVLTRCKVIA